MPKNPLYFRENRSVLSAGKYKLAYILVSLGNKNPPILLSLHGTLHENFLSKSRW